MMKRFMAFLRTRGGNIGILAAAFLPVLLGGTGYALDYVNMSRYHVLLQEAADAAAVASARQLNFMQGLKDDERQVALGEFAQQMVDIQLLPTQRPAEAALKALEDDRIEVVATHIMKPIFDGLPGFKSFSVSARAVAQALQGQNVCVIATETKSNDAIKLQGDARITGPSCAVYSNSLGPTGVNVQSSSVIEAALICSAGGNSGGAKNYKPGATSDCPQLEDPLASRAPPAGGGLCYPGLVIDGPGLLFTPGRYCGDVIIKNGATVLLTPGVYQFENSRLIVETGAELVGKNVGLYFKGDSASFQLKDDVTIELSGRTSGAMAGMLVYADPSDVKRDFIITTPNVKSLVGAIYMPADRLSINTTAPVGASSAFTVLIAREVLLEGSPSLVLNTDYDLTSVPVPNGIRNVGARARLVN